MGACITTQRSRWFTTLALEFPQPRHFGRNVVGLDVVDLLDATFSRSTVPAFSARWAHRLGSPAAVVAAAARMTGVHRDYWNASPQKRAACVHIGGLANPFSTAQRREWCISVALMRTR